MEVTRTDRIRNDLIRGRAEVEQSGDKVRGTRLRYFARVQRRGKWIYWIKDVEDRAVRQEEKRRVMDVKKTCRGLV